MVDEATIDALYRASQAGVPVDLVIRGICALRPGVPGLSRDDPRPLDPRPLPRALAHLRVRERRSPAEDATFEGPEVYIGSADLMHRNLDRRVEALVRIADPDQVSELIELLDESMDDGTASWHLGPDGRWERHHVGPDGPLVDLQAALIQPAAAPARHRPVSPTQPRAAPAVVEAAGALVWRVRLGKLQVALVHRPRYGDWSWPKGKVDPGETILGAATREVAEETGARRRPRHPAARPGVRRCPTAAASACTTGPPRWPAGPTRPPCARARRRRRSRSRRSTSCAGSTPTSRSSA